jgi:hypothetical protein
MRDNVRRLYAIARPFCNVCAGVFDECRRRGDVGGGRSFEKMRSAHADCLLLRVFVVKEQIKRLCRLIAQIAEREP